jgi:hypothetical protein
MQVIIGYESNGFLPDEIDTIFKVGKNDLCHLSREPDKTLIIVDEMRRMVINWFADNGKVQETEHIYANYEGPCIYEKLVLRRIDGGVFCTCKDSAYYESHCPYHPDDYCYCDTYIIKENIEK